MTPCMYLLKWFFYSFFFKSSNLNGYVVVKKWSTNRGKLNKLTQRWTNWKNKWSTVAKREPRKSFQKEMRSPNTCYCRMSTTKPSQEPLLLNHFRFSISFSYAFALENTPKVFFMCFSSFPFCIFNQSFHGRTFLRNACNYGHFLYVFFCSKLTPKYFRILNHFIFKASKVSLQFNFSFQTIKYV